MGVRGLWKRLTSDGIMSVATVLTVAMTLLLLAVGPIYADAVALGAARATLQSAALDDTTVDVSTRVAPEADATLDDIVRRSVTDRGHGVDATVRRSSTSGTFRLPTRPQTPLDEVAAFRAIDGIDRRVTLVDGTWPRDPTQGDPVEVAIDERIADELGIGVGDVVEVARTGADRGVESILVGGVYRILDDSDRYWVGLDGLVAGGTASTQFRTFTFIATPAAVTERLSTRIDADWLVEYALDDVGLDELVRLRRDVASLENRLRAGFGRSVEDADVASAIEVDTRLDSLLSGTARSLTVTRSSVFGVVFQLALLAGYALLLTAAIANETRRRESTLLRSRGARVRDLGRLAAAEAAMIAVPLALAAPFAAAWLLKLADQVGPLSTIGLEIAPRPTARSFLFTLVGAALSIAVLVLPVLRGAHRAERSAESTRETPTSTSQRTGLDLALVSLTAVAFWQLATLGDERATQLRGRFGVDPLLIVAPALGLCAAALIALRIVPVVARRADTVSARSRRATAALTGWQIARRPSRYARTALLLTAAVAVGVLALTFTSTWRESQRAQATHEIGADARVVPNRRSGESIADLQLTTAYESVDGVNRAVGASRWRLTPPGTERPAAVVAMAADRAGDVALGHDDETKRAIGEALAQLAARRPDPGSLRLPGRPHGIVATIEVIEAPLVVDDVPVDPAIAATVDLVIRDGVGALHRVRLGTAAAGEPPNPARADMAVEVGDQWAAPIAPIELVAIEAKWATPPVAPREGTVTVSGVTVIDRDGTVTPIDELDAGAWTAQISRFGSVTAAPSATVTPDAGGVRFALATGFVSQPVVVVAAALPTGGDAPSSVPVAVTERYLAESGAAMGDRLRLSSIGSGFDDVEIVATVPSFPTVDMREMDAVVADLPTVQLAAWRPGEPIGPVDEYWIELRTEAADAEPLLRAPPLEISEFASLDQRIDRRTTDPPAIGTLGAMSIGFVAAAVFATIGFAVSASISARERADEFATLRALGLSRRQLGRWLAGEQVIVGVTGLVLGLAIGLAMSAFLLPRISLTQRGEAIFPPLKVTYPWGSIGVIVAGLAIIVSAAIAGIVIQVVRLDRDRSRIGDVE